MSSLLRSELQGRRGLDSNGFWDITLRYLFILFVFFLSGSGTSGAQGTRYPEVEIGSKAPDFSLPFATRDTIEFNEISL